MIAPNKQRHAMVLAGGGAYGAYEVGVMKALLGGKSRATNYKTMRPDSFAGTSIGAVNAVVSVANWELETERAVDLLYRFWVDELAGGPGRCGNGAFRIRGIETLELDCLTKPGRLLSNLLADVGDAFRTSVERGVAYATSNESLTRRTLELLDFSVLFDRHEFTQELAKVAPLRAIRDSDQRLRVVATNFDTGELAVFTNEDIADRVGHQAIMASSAVPGIFPWVEIDGDVYTDGGTLLNTPFLPVVHGSDVLHVIYMDPDVRSIPLETLQTTLGVLDRLLVTNFAFAMNRSIESIHDFNESIRLIRSLDGSSSSDADLRALLDVTTSLKGRVTDEDYDPLIIHRYHPRDDLGGVFGFLDFDIDHIEALIERGFRDAVEHDCEAAGCLV